MPKSGIYGGSNYFIFSGSLVFCYEDDSLLVLFPLLKNNHLSGFWNFSVLSLKWDTVDLCSVGMCVGFDESTTADQISIFNITFAPEYVFGKHSSRHCCNPRKKLAANDVLQIGN